MAECIVVFAEGDTDEVVFKKIIAGLKKDNPDCNALKSLVVNLKGVGNYSFKAIAKLKGEILPNARKKKDNIKAVICAHDTDVFEFDEQPPVNWPTLLKDIKALVPKNTIVSRLGVKHSMEDWLLQDMDGLCKYLKLAKPPKKLKGKNGYEKIKNLFRMRDKVYTKGFDAQNLVDKIDIDLIIKNHQKDLSPLIASLTL